MLALRCVWLRWVALVGSAVCECSRIDRARLLMVDVTCCESRVTHCLHLHVTSE